MPTELLAGTIGLRELSQRGCDLDGFDWRRAIGATSVQLLRTGSSMNQDFAALAAFKAHHRGVLVEY